MIPKILLCGHTQSGKTTGAKALAGHYGCGHANTSDALKAEFDVLHPGVLRQEPPADDLRNRLFNFAVQQAGDDPARYTRLALEMAPIVTGTRRQDEFAASRYLFDMAAWIENPFVPKGETDKARPSMCDIIVPSLFNPATGVCENDFEEDLIRAVTEWLAKPEAYMAGRYRVWRPDGTYDAEAMKRNALAEAYWASVLEDCGYRTFCPINTHLILDNRWGQEDSARHILTLCVGRVRRMPKDSVIVVRDGWDDDPESAGTRIEYDVAIERGLKPIYTKHGAANVRGYATELKDTPR